MLFSKPKDLRTEQKQNNPQHNPNAINEDERVQNTGNGYGKLLLIPLLPIFLLFKLLDYIHLITFVIFGALLLYFGVAKFLSNSWTETVLLISIGLALMVAPVLYVLDKDK